MMLKKDMEIVVRYLQEHLVMDFGFKDDEVVESLQECIAGNTAREQGLFSSPALRRTVKLGRK